jgi:acetyl esterase/lipase
MDLLRQLYEGIRPVVQGLFSPGISLQIRWRMVTLGLFSSLGVAFKYLPWMFSRAYSVHRIPNRHGHKLRNIVFQPPPSPTDSQKLRPLHLAIHGGAFIGGTPEYAAEWATHVSRKTGAVVVCSSYRTAPKHVFPAAHDDTDDVIEYLLNNAERLWNADPRLLTVSGLSAGGNLGMAAAQQPRLRPGEDTSIKAGVFMYGSVSNTPVLFF